MNLEKYVSREKVKGIGGLYNVAGSFGYIDGCLALDERKNGDTAEYTYRHENKVVLRTVFREFPNGVISRRDYIKNVSGREQTVNRFFARFAFPGGDYRVYTQNNFWQNENGGAWQTLNTEITARTYGLRSCDGATPIFALKNEISGDVTVFHLVPNCQWKMSAAKKVFFGYHQTVIFEAGINDSALALKVADGEEIALPELFFYDCASELDLDAYKLHQVVNTLYPRKMLPILYNTWLNSFDLPDYDDLRRQIVTAKELGFEMFMVDAGWFGEGIWDLVVGDWEESQNGSLGGRLSEISDFVRENGMVFGLWLEPERVGPNSKALREHPSFYLAGKLLNFADDEARAYVTEVTKNIIRRYHVGYLKIDFNATIPYDESGSGFYRFFQGEERFIAAIREEFPDLYLSNCASGGHRIDLWQSRLADSFWISDNQGPIGGLRIYKDLIKRCPPSNVEKWNVQTLSGKLPLYGLREKTEYMINCNNAEWTSVTRVSDDYALYFLTGGPLGMSCDIAAFPDDYKRKVKAFIAKYKEDRAFYASAAAKLLCDRENVVGIEYFDEDYAKVVVQVFTKEILQNTVTLKPAVDPDAVYRTENRRVTGKELTQDGICLSVEQNGCAVAVFRKIS